MYAYITKVAPFATIAAVAAAAIVIDVPAPSSEQREERYICTTLALVDEVDRLRGTYRSGDRFLTERQRRAELHTLADKLISLQPPALRNCELKIVDAEARAVGYGIREESYEPRWQFFDRIEECWSPEILWYWFVAARAQCAGENPPAFDPRGWQVDYDYDLRHWLE